MEKAKFGSLISDLRKEKSMTQKELAEKLNVTDKAISKWERGYGFPEITIIPELAKVLGVSIGELFSGQQNTQDNPKHEESDDLIKGTIEFIEDVSKHKATHIAFSITSALFLLGVFVCILCNYLINKNIGWSLYPTGAITVAWLILTPLLLFRKRKLFWSFISMTISIPLLLLLIEQLSPAKGWLLPLALPIHILFSALVLLVIYVFSYKKIDMLYASAISVFSFGVILNLAVKIIVDHYLSIRHDNTSAVIVALSCAFLSITMAIFGIMKKKRK